MHSSNLTEQLLLLSCCATFDNIAVLLVDNGQLYAGTLPNADVYRYVGGTEWVYSGCIDNTPDVIYRRGALYIVLLPLDVLHALQQVERDERSQWRLARRQRGLRPQNRRLHARPQPRAAEGR